MESQVLRWCQLLCMLLEVSNNNNDFHTYPFVQAFWICVCEKSSLHHTKSTNENKNELVTNTNATQCMCVSLLSMSYTNREYFQSQTSNNVRERLSSDWMCGVCCLVVKCTATICKLDSELGVILCDPRRYIDENSHVSKSIYFEFESILALIHVRTKFKHPKTESECRRITFAWEWFKMDFRKRSIALRM